MRVRTGGPYSLIPLAVGTVVVQIAGLLVILFPLSQLLVTSMATEPVPMQLALPLPATYHQQGQTLGERIVMEVGQTFQ